MTIVMTNIVEASALSDPSVPKAIGSEKIIPIIIPCSHQDILIELMPIPKPSKALDKMIDTAMPVGSEPPELANKKQTKPNTIPRIVAIVTLLAIEKLRKLLNKSGKTAPVIFHRAIRK